MQISNIDYNLYKYFVAVYQHKNIARAAETLFVTASAVGMRIKELSKQLSVTLFVPHARGVTPTKEADELFKKVTSAFAIIGEAESSVQNINSETAGEIRIGCPSTILELLGDFVCKFLTEHPNIKLVMVHEQRNTLCEMLSKRNIDVIITKLPIDILGDFEIKKLCLLPKSFFASRDFIKRHKLPATINTADISGVPFILPDKSRENTRKIMELLGDKLDTVIEVAGNNDLIYSVIKRGIGVGYCNDCCVNPHDPVERITVKDVNLPVDWLYVVHNKTEPGKIVLTFLDLLYKTLSK